MGRALASSLLAEGFPVCCHDISPDAMRPVLAQGADCAPHPMAVARSSDLVMSFLPGPAEVADVALNAEHGVLAGLRPDALMLEHVDLRAGHGDAAWHRVRPERAAGSWTARSAARPPT